MGLFRILRLLEVHFGENRTASRYLGLAEHAPRLAVFSIVFGFAVVGLPGTLSFRKTFLFAEHRCLTRKQGVCSRSRLRWML